MPKGGAEGCSCGPMHNSEVSEQVGQRDCQRKRESKTEKVKSSK